MQDSAFHAAIDAETAARAYFDEYSAVLHASQDASLPSSSSNSSVLRPPPLSEHTVVIEDSDAFPGDLAGDRPQPETAVCKRYRAWKKRRVGHDVLAAPFAGLPSPSSSPTALPSRPAIRPGL